MPDLITPEELKQLIEQTYKVEEEYISLRKSYEGLQETISEVVEFLPNAIWVLAEDGSIFLQNSKAKELENLFKVLENNSNDYEMNFEEESYLIKTSSYQDKIMISATDITEQKRKENLATMGQMAAHLSHEIRNPIGSISLLSSTLMKRVKVENKPIVLEIQKSVYRIDRIIKATLMFSKGIKTALLPMKWSELKEEIEMVIGYYSYSKEITFDLHEEDFELRGDIDLLSMMFSNFIVNAIDAIELDEDDDDEGVISVKVHKSDTEYIFHIYDSGVAIENPNNLFEAFKSTKEKGNGLGLILSKQIATAHNGTVSLLDSDEKIFEIKLPR
jgi:two-component system NtrC family sensor kinase/two-component system sensor histidine kinase AtoS